MLTVLNLYNIYEKGGELTPSILCDLFGSFNWSAEITQNKDKYNERVQLMDGLFKGLFLMEVKPEEIEKYRRKNKLDELIHLKYKNSPTGYYKQYCENNVTIGKTHY